ncbi:MAG: hypothetical protein EB168_12095, partial [Euryarchaeota archaeon]|nr:hypothetical protein [Euryarchaeota archaeon]
ILDDFTRTVLQGDVNAGSIFIDDQIPYQEVVRYLDLNQISLEPILDPETNLPFGGNQALEVYLEPTRSGLGKIQSDTIVFERSADLAQTGYLFDKNLPLNWSIEGSDLVIEMEYEGYDDLGNPVSNPATIRYRKLGTYGTGQSLVHMTADYLDQQYTQITYAVPDNYLGTATETDLQDLLGRGQLLVGGGLMTNPSTYTESAPGVRSIDLNQVWGFELGLEDDALSLNTASSNFGFRKGTAYWQIDTNSVSRQDYSVRWAIDQGVLTIRLTYIPSTNSFGDCEFSDPDCLILREYGWRILDYDTGTQRLHVIDKETDPRDGWVYKTPVTTFYEPLLQDQD